MLKLTLHGNSFDWRFVGSGTSDSGTATCHGPQRPPASTASFTTTTSGLTAAFADTSTGSPASWAWDFGDGTTATVRNPSHAYARAGTYTVKLTVTNAGGSTSAVQRITVSARRRPARRSRRRPAATAGCPAAIARYERQCVCASPGSAARSPSASDRRS